MKKRRTAKATNTNQKSVDHFQNRTTGETGESTRPRDCCSSSNTAFVMFLSSAQLPSRPLRITSGMRVTCVPDETHESLRPNTRSMNLLKWG
jgi:hypothetical protein